MSDHPFPQIAFILASTDHGTMIVNRFDHQMGQKGGFGVGFKILQESSQEAGEISIGSMVLDLKRRFAGDGVVAIDCGASVGTHTIGWARQMSGWGSVIAIEAQQRIYYALAGNVAINNCFNTRLIHATAGNKIGIMNIPNPNHPVPTKFAGPGLMPFRNPEQIGQDADYTEAKPVPVDAITIDSLELERLDFLKIDVEGTACEVLEGATRTIKHSRPVILVEHAKTGTDDIQKFLNYHGYHMGPAGLNVLAIHPSDRTSEGFGHQARLG